MTLDCLRLAWLFALLTSSLDLYGPFTLAYLKRSCGLPAGGRAAVSRWPRERPASPLRNFVDMAAISVLKGTAGVP